MEIIWYNCLTWLHSQTSENMTVFVNRVTMVTKTKTEKKNQNEWMNENSNY